LRPLTFSPNTMPLQIPAPLSPYMHYGIMD
jgi:hypothetical protein